MLQAVLHWCVADCAVNCTVYCMPIVTLVVHRSSRSGHRSLTSYIADDHDLCLPHLHSTLRLGGSLSEYCHDVRWCGRTRMVWLHDDEKILKICLFVLTESINVTDRRTNTAWRHRPRLCIASRGKKNTGHCLFLFLSVFFTFFIFCYHSWWINKDVQKEQETWLLNNRSRSASYNKQSFRSNTS